MNGEIMENIEEAVQRLSNLAGHLGVSTGEIGNTLRALGAVEGPEGRDQFGVKFDEANGIWGTQASTNVSDWGTVPEGTSYWVRRTELEQARAWARTWKRSAKHHRLMARAWARVALGRERVMPDADEVAEREMLDDHALELEPVYGERDGWIDLLDEYPEPERLVLIGNWNTVAYARFNRFHGVWYTPNGIEIEWNVTHWQPMPPPPTEDVPF